MNNVNGKRFFATTTKTHSNRMRISLSFKRAFLRIESIVSIADDSMVFVFGRGVVGVETSFCPEKIVARIGMIA